MDTQTAAPFGTFCNLEHLFHAMAARGLDGIVATQPLNIYYLSRFNGLAHKSDEPRPYAVVISRHAPDHPILVIADYYLSTAAELAVPISDIRPFRAVMMPLDLPPAASDVDRFIDAGAASRPWIDAARAKYRLTMGEALADAIGALGVTQGRVGFADLGFGPRLGLAPPPRPPRPPPTRPSTPPPSRPSTPSRLPSRSSHHRVATPARAQHPCSIRCRCRGT